MQKKEHTAQIGIFNKWKFSINNEDSLFILFIFEWNIVSFIKIIGITILRLRLPGNGSKEILF